ncbi:DNA-binding protein [Spartinivicinus ruber]|uniref:DNA-binding protein n=1 Tax=Spartinivicinus ruber TaxID=2683272 RepID=UPI0013D86C92|nr:DNA-binding protein [Spartinivicinus ruber]
MRLISLENYRKTKFPFGDGPSMGSLRRQCRSGDLAGARKEGKLWYVDIDVASSTSGDPLVEKVLSEIGML